MRLAFRATALMALMGAFFIPMPAQASQTAGFAFSAFSGTGVTRSHFTEVAKCTGNPSTSPVKGVDAAILSTAAFPAGYTLTIRWTGQVAPTGTLSASLYKADCSRVLPLSTSGGVSPTQPYRVQIPAGTKWIVIDGTLVANVSITMT